MTQDKLSSGTLAAGGIAGLFASSCCVAPLVLVSLGLGGSWLGSLRVLEPYQPIFIGVAVVSLFLAYRRIFRPAAVCSPGEICASGKTRTVYQILFWVVAALVLTAAVFPYLAPL